jgi:hypothetical protein
MMFIKRIPFFGRYKVAGLERLCLYVGVRTTGQPR